MVFLACGLNHKTAPLPMREQVALPMEDTVLKRLITLPEVNEVAFLSTCNRTEIYCDTDDPSVIVPWLAHEHGLSSDTLAPHCYQHLGPQGVRHALRVASGLDSMMLGEPQILGQMKQAYQQAQQAGTLKHQLQQVFQYVFGATKRIRHQSGIGNNPISIAYAAVRLIGQIFPDYRPLRAFLIGSGETASLVATYLQKEGVQQFMVASRTPHHTAALASQIQAKTLSIGDIPHHLAHADVIISATSCPVPFISKQLVEHALSSRKETPMVFLDLAMPRDIEPNVSELTGVHLYNLDDLQHVVEKGMAQRQLSAQKAEELIEAELHHYLQKHRTQQAKQVICNYRNQMQILAQHELHRAKQKLSVGTCPLSVMEEFGERLVRKLTHTPTIGLRHAAIESREELLDFARYLLDHSPYEKIT